MLAVRYIIGLSISLGFGLSVVWAVTPSTPTQVAAYQKQMAAATTEAARVKILKSLSLYVNSRLSTLEKPPKASSKVQPIEYFYALKESLVFIPTSSFNSRSCINAQNQIVASFEPHENLLSRDNFPDGALDALDILQIMCKATTLKPIP